MDLFVNRQKLKILWEGGGGWPIMVWGPRSRGPSWIPSSSPALSIQSSTTLPQAALRDARLAGWQQILRKLVIWWNTWCWKGTCWGRDMNMKWFYAEREMTQYFRDLQLAKREQQQHYLMELGKYWNQARYRSCDAATQTREISPKTFCWVQHQKLETVLSKMENFISDDQTHFWYWLSWRAPNISSGDRRTGKQLTNTLCVETIHIVRFHLTKTHKSDRKLL